MSALVNFRREGNFYLAYFVQLRKLLALNPLGRDIVDCFFNKDFHARDIATFCSSKNKSEDVDLEVVENFLVEIKEDLKSDLNDGYTLPLDSIPSAPISVELQINTECNLRCKHCFQDSYASVMSLKKAKKILKTLKKAGIFEVNLVGGEVFLHPNFFEILQLCVKYNYAINIVTNGTFLSEENIEKLKSCKNIAVLVSLEGVGEVNDFIRGEGMFAVVDDGVKKLLNAGIYTEISNTLTAKNVAHANEIFAYAEKLGVACNFNLFKPFKDTHSDLVLSPEEYFCVGIDIAKNKETRSGLTNAAIMSRLLKGTKRDECRATLLGLSIDVAGQMIPCVSLKEAGYYEGKELPLLDDNFLDAWKNNRHFKEFRDVGFRECQARSYIFNNDIRRVDPYGVSSFEKYLKSIE